MLLNNPSERILVASAVLSNASDMVKEAGDQFIRNALFRELYPEHCPQNPKMPDTVWTRSQIELPNREDFSKMEKSIEAHGSDSSVVSRHYSYMKFDDIVAPGYYETPELRKKMLNYVRSCFALREFPNTPVDFIGTPWHDSDAYSEIENWGNVETIKISAEYIEDNKRVSIFPEFFDIPVLDILKKEYGSYLYSSLMLMDPVPEESQVFKSSWWVHFDYIKEFDEGSGFQKIKREDDEGIVPIGYRFMTVDPAKKEGAGDYSAIIVITTDKENNWYILDLWRGQVNPMTLADKIIEMAYYWFPQTIGIESIAYQEMLKLYVEEKMRREGIVLNVTEIKQSTRLTKEMKIKSVQPLFESKCIYYPRGHALTPILKEELERFPTAKTDDLADALQMQRELVFPSGGSVIKSKDPKSIDVWKERLRKWHKNKSKFFKDYEMRFKGRRSYGQA